VLRGSNLFAPKKRGEKKDFVKKKQKLKMEKKQKI